MESNRTNTRVLDRGAAVAVRVFLLSLRSIILAERISTCYQASSVSKPYNAPRVHSVARKESAGF